MEDSEAWELLQRAGATAGKVEADLRRQRAELLNSSAWASDEAGRVLAGAIAAAARVGAALKKGEEDGKS
ncbi:MAG: hypothetical protein ABSH22_03970 [Tepidisphaeraceae bacterium]|jgi:hypothetical protein